MWISENIDIKTKIVTMVKKIMMINLVYPSRRSNKHGCIQQKIAQVHNIKSNRTNWRNG